MVKLENLDFKYAKGRPWLFHDLDCELDAGSIVGLLGKNGAGKTTLLKIMVGLLSPSGGQVEIMGVRPFDRCATFLRDVYFLPEEFHIPDVSVQSYVNANAGFYPRFDIDLLTRLISDFELPETKSLQKLSYGQKKKFMISFALSTKCRLLVLDEPTNGLDIPSKSIFRRVLAGSLDEDQLVIISTHQVHDVERLIDRVLMLEHGQFIIQKDILDISSKLHFAITTSADGENILYKEQVPGEYKVIKSETDGSSAVDVELLFNAISEGNIQIQEYVK